MDHYKILGLNGEATIEEIKAAFRQLAIRWHPDKNLNNIEEAEEKFKLISEAYKVLTDPEKRKKYDLNEKQRSNWFSPSPSSPRSEEDNCESSSSGKFSYTSFSDSLFASFFGKGAAFKAAPIEYPVSCTLEELYVGTVKNIVLTRDVLSARGKLKQAKEILTINIKPGLKNGAKFIFKEKGSEKPNTIPADIIVILHQKPHDLFTREGDDLIVSENISLLQVLTCSCGIDLKTLDKRSLMVPINCVSFPFHEKVIKGEGMPLANDPSKKGDLRIKLNARLF